MKEVFEILKGMAIGVANIIPGVSGGTMAFILGIYEKLTESIGEFFTNKEKRLEYFWFLLRIGMGAGLGILLFAKLIGFLLSSSLFQIPTFFFFIGLIVASIPFILRAHSEMRATSDRIFLLLLAFVLVAVSALLGEGHSSEIAPRIVRVLDLKIIEIQITALSVGRFFWLMLCGFLAAASMIVPGFSGSALLVTLGEYRHFLAYIEHYQIVPLAAAGIGGVLGILITARFIDWLLKRYPARTLYFILGLILASLFQIFLEVRPNFRFAFVPLLLDFVFLLFGLSLSFVMGRFQSEGK